MDEGDVCAPHRGGAGYGIAHLAGGVVGQVAHRVQRLLGGAGRHGDAQPDQVLRAGNGVEDVLNEDIFLRQAAAAHIFAGQHTALGRDDGEAVTLQRGDVVLGDRVFQHPGVHGRGDQLRAFGREDGRGQHVVGDAVGHLGDDIGRGRCNEDDVGLFGQCNMGDLELEIPVESVHHALVAGERFKRDGGDELGGVPGHDDLDVGPQLAQCAGDIRHFIGGNAAGDAQKDAFSVQIHPKTSQISGLLPLV